MNLHKSVNKTWELEEKPPNLQTQEEKKENNEKK